MQAVVVPGPGNGRELMDSLARVTGLKIRPARSTEDVRGVDLIITPRGPSRSFSKWYREDPLGQAVVAAYNRGTPWIALCGSSLPLSAQLGTGCDGIDPLSLIAIKGTNDRLMGHQEVVLADGTRLPFHFTSAPSYEALEGTETLGSVGVDGAVLRGEELVVSSGLPMTQDGWGFLFQAAGCPLTGAQIR